MNIYRNYLVATILMCGIGGLLHAVLTQEASIITFENRTGETLDYARFKIQLNGPNILAEKKFNQYGCTRGSVIARGVGSEMIQFDTLRAIKKVRTVTKDQSGKKKIKEVTGENLNIASYMNSINAVYVMAFVAYIDGYKVKVKLSSKKEGDNKCQAIGLVDAYYALSKEDDKYVLMVGESAESISATYDCKRKKIKK